MLLSRIEFTRIPQVYFQTKHKKIEIVFEYPKHNITYNGIFIYSVYYNYFINNRYSWEGDTLVIKMVPFNIFSKDGIMVRWHELFNTNMGFDTLHAMSHEQTMNRMIGLNSLHRIVHERIMNRMIQNDDPSNDNIKDID